MATRLEQETTVVANREEDVVYIYTANPVHLRRLRNDARATETKGGEDWAEFTIPADKFDPLKGFRRQGRVMTDEEKAAAGDRLRRARENNAPSS